MLFHFWTLAALIGPGLAPTAQPVVNLFIEACVDGELTSKYGVAEQITFESLPSRLRNRVKEWKLGTFYRVSQADEAYVMFAQEGPFTSAGVTHLCAVVSPYMDLLPAFDAVVEEITGRPSADSGSAGIAYRHINITDGYVVSASILTSAVMTAKPKRTQYRMLRVAWMTAEKMREYKISPQQGGARAPKESKGRTKEIR